MLSYIFGYAVNFIHHVVCLALLPTATKPVQRSSPPLERVHNVHCSHCLPACVLGVVARPDMLHGRSVGLDCSPCCSKGIVGPMALHGINCARPNDAELLSWRCLLGFGGGEQCYLVPGFRVPPTSDAPAGLSVPLSREVRFCWAVSTLYAQA